MASGGFMLNHETNTNRLYPLRWLWISLTILILDQLSKHAISNAFYLGESRYVLPFFNLVLAHNAGAAFSFLAGASGWQREFFITVAVVISAALIWMLKSNHRNRLLSTALALVIGGALGNLVDRVRFGYVVDFIQWYIPHSGLPPWPAFNIADSAICVGAALLILDSFRKPEVEKK
ncbi:MAG: lipoprotein signal peptidase [Betaproteobacteria bacterium]|nr:lipoprotein signal peptidase [Betaproteobacteria bacterium]